MRRSLRTRILLLAAALTLTTALFLATGAGANEAPVEEYRITTESQARTQAGDCPQGQVCKQLCITFQGRTRQMQDFQCFDS